MARSLPVRGLTEGAVLAALVALLAFAARYLPLLGLVASFLCPIPLTVLVIRHGARVALLAGLVATALGSIISGPVTGLLIALGFAPTGVAIGVGLRRQMPAATIVLLTGAVALLSLIVGGATASAGIGVDPRVTMREVIELNKRSLDDVVQRYARLGIDTARIETTVQMMRDFLDYSVRLIPLLLVVGSLTNAYLNYEIARAVLRRIGIRAPALPPVSMWGLPSAALWALPLGSLLAVIGAQRMPAVEAVGVNLAFFVTMALLSQGMLAGWVLMEKYRMPKWYRVVVLLLFLSGPTGVVVFFLGLADAAFDLRRRWRPAAELTAS